MWIVEEYVVESVEKKWWKESVIERNGEEA